MSLVNRRQSLQIFLDGLLHTASTVVLASCVLPARAEPSQTHKSTEEALKDLERRADQVAAAAPPCPDNEAQEACAFLNGGFVNGFRKADFHNGGFVNGTFRKADFNNGGFRNGGFVNGTFRN